MQWVIKLREFNNYEQQANNENQIIYQVKQRQNFSGEEGQKVLLLVFENKDWKFLYKGVLTKIERFETQENGVIRYIIIIGNLVNLEPPNDLSDFCYSLTRIRNFYDPIKNFRRNKSLISNAEFEAIENGQIFVSRTVFGKIINSLHNEHRLEFTNQLIQEKPEFYYQNRNYLEAFKLLRLYVTKNIIHHVDWLIDTYNMLENLLTSEELGLVGFQIIQNVDKSSKEQQRIDRLKDQIELFNEYREILDPIFWLEMESQIRIASETESSFNKLFDNRPLPIMIS